MRSVEETLFYRIVNTRESIVEVCVKNAKCRRILNFQRLNNYHAFYFNGLEEKLVTIFEPLDDYLFEFALTDY
jgi:hypothetical protein